MLDQIRLARVRLAQDEPAESAAVGLRAVELAGPVRSGVAIDLLTGYNAELAARYPAYPAALGFQNRLREHLRTVA